MKTPTRFKINLENRILTEEMLALAIFSMNKRAKNMRDKQAMYRTLRYDNKFWIDNYNYEEKYKDKKEEYYWKKEKLLSLLSPKCVHRDAKNNLFLYFECFSHGFHQPIHENQLKNYDLKIVDIGDFHTFGKDIQDLVSVQFVDRIIQLIDEDDYVFLNEKEKES